MCLDSHTWTHCYPNEMQHGVLMAYFVYLVHWLLGEKYKPGLRTAQPYMSSIRHLCCTKMHRKNITLNFLVFCPFGKLAFKQLSMMAIEKYSLNANWPLSSRMEPLRLTRDILLQLNHISSQKYENKNLWSEKFKIAIEPRFKFVEYGEYEKFKILPLKAWQRFKLIRCFIFSKLLAL